MADYTNKVITVAFGLKYTGFGLLTAITVEFDEIIIPLNLLIV